MTFAQKLTLGILLLLCAALSLGGGWTIEQNLAHALRRAESQDTALHLQQRAALESALRESGTASLSGAVQTAQDLDATEQTSSSPYALLTGDGTSVHDKMPAAVLYQAQMDALDAGAGSLCYFSGGGARYILLASPLQTRVDGLWLVSAYDVTALYDERDRQLGQYLLLEVLTLALAGAAAAGLARLATRPLRALQGVTRAMAEGAYDRRVPPAGTPEFDALGRDFNAMADAVESRVQALREEADRRSRFVAAFTHEIKTPMTSILGYADYLRLGEQPPQRRQAAADYIYHESRRLEALSHRLLLLLELEQGGVTLSPTPVHAMFADVRRSLPPDIAEALQTEEPEGETALVPADRVLLGDLLRNLALNAWQAAPRDNTVRMGCRRCPEGWQLWVADKGRGIPKEELGRVTEAFYMVDKSRARRSGGSGLGLSLCAEIARAHGTTLAFDSEPGRGTTVTLVLPEVKE